MQTTSYSDEQYSGDFLGDQDLKKRALDRAIDIRKFEIDAGISPNRPLSL